MRWIVFFVTLLVSAAAIDAASESTLLLKVEWQGSTFTNGQVFWSSDSQEFIEQRSTHFDVKRGPQTIAVKLPSRLRWLRFDPAQEPGKVRLIGARIKFSLLPFEFTEFDSPQSFQAWATDSGRQLRNPVLRSGALEYDSVGEDPYLLSPPLYGVALLRWLQILIAAVLVASGVSALAPIGRRGRAPRFLAYGAAAAAAVAAVSFGVSRMWQETRWFGSDHRDVSIPGYDLSFYDMFGRPVSTRRGPLAMVIDPFTIYRNYPNQSAEKFKIDSNGFRESGPSKPGASTAFVLGGSTTFGLAAPSDEDTFVYRMSAANPRIHYVNAAVVGFQSSQELALMIHHLDSFAPKLYLAVDGWNDVQQNLQDPHGDDLGFNHSTFDLFQDHLFRLASLQSAGLPGLKAPVSLRGESQDFEDKLIHRYLENVERMNAFAKSRGAAFALAIQPTLTLKKNLSPLEDRHSVQWRNSKPTKRAAAVYRRLARETLSLCSRLGARCLDLNSDPEFVSTRETFFADDCHFTPAGNQWVAAALEKFLK